jgi:hypothetical protein
MNCVAVLKDLDGGQRHCKRGAKRDGFCTQHHPDWPAKVAAEAAASKAYVQRLIEAEVESARRTRSRLEIIDNVRRTILAELDRRDRARIVLLGDGARGDSYRAALIDLAGWLDGAGVVELEP